jgi:hypothetical protein
MGNLFHKTFLCKGGGVLMIVVLGDYCEYLVWVVPGLDRRISLIEKMVICIENFEARLEIRYLVILLQSCHGGAICHNSRNVLSQIINAISFEKR